MRLPFAAIVPVYNPEPGLEALCKSLTERFETVVVVDDGSVEEVEVFARLPQAVTLLRHLANAGKGRAMKTALAWLRENRPGVAGAVFADGDGQHRIGDVAAVAQRSLETGRVVFGVRDFGAKGVPFRSWWGNRWTAAEVRLLFGFRLADTQTGLRAVPRRLWDALLSLGGERFEYEAGWFGCLKRREEPILEVPIETVYRAGNRASHFRPLKDTLLTQGALFISGKHKESTSMNIKATLALGTAFGMLSGFGAIRAVTPDQWGGAAKGWQMQRHNEKMGAVTNGGAKVVFIGDSITHFWETNGKAQQAKYFSQGDWKMLDLGTSADRTEHVIWRLTEGKELDGYEAKCILLMIGTNNSGHFPFEKEPPSDTILGIRKILNVITEKQPKATVVLTAIFPRGRDANDTCRRRNEIVNKEIVKFADGQRIFWCDFNDQFLTPVGELTPEIFPDLLHPNALGYEIWFSAVKPYIDYALSDGKLPKPANRYAPFVRREKYRTTEAIAQYPVTRIRSEGYGKFDWWLDRLLEKRNEIADAKGEIDLVFFGDSITHNWEGPGKESLAELRKTYSVLDIGYSGDQTEHLVWRGENGELDGYKAKCIMLMIGTNNTWHRNDHPEAIAAGIRKILSVIAKKQPQAKTLLLPIFPFGDSPKDAKRINNEKVNEMIKCFADGNKVIWVDFNVKFLDEKGDNVKWMPDHCHPNAAGYKEIWLPAVLPYFKEIVGK